MRACGGQMGGLMHALSPRADAVPVSRLVLPTLNKAGGFENRPFCNCQKSLGGVLRLFF
jgi:hypothetical protein